MKSEERDYCIVAGCILGIAISIFGPRYCGSYSSSAGPLTSLTPLHDPPGVVGAAGDASSSAPASLAAEAGARLSNGQVAQYAQEAAQNAWDEGDCDTKAGSTPALAATLSEAQERWRTR